MVDRTTKWVKEQITALQSQQNGPQPAIFPPILPLNVETQKEYLQTLKDLLAENKTPVQGLAIYGVEALHDLPDQFRGLPKLGLTAPATPHQILSEIAQGIDLFTLPFLGAATDAGIALDFSFPASKAHGSEAQVRALGVDMWSEQHAVDLSPLGRDCGCYACTSHHRAYVRHLLTAKEMLGWTLLQIHNLWVVEDFFAGVRKSISEGKFEQDRKDFEVCYEPKLPPGTGQGPRLVLTTTHAYF